MLERGLALGRAGIHAVVGFFGGLGRHVADWARGRDVTLLVVLVVVALLLLFAFVPNRRRP